MVSLAAGRCHRWQLLVDLFALRRSKWRAYIPTGPRKVLRLSLLFQHMRSKERSQHKLKGETEQAWPEIQEAGRGKLATRNTEAQGKKSRQRANLDQG